MGTIPQFYYESHFRSLQISRFHYTNIFQITRISAIRIVALVPPSHYEVAASLMFFASGMWPYSQVFVKKKRKRGGKSFLVLLYLTLMGETLLDYGMDFLWRLAHFDFPCIDAADPKADYVFVIRGVYRNATVYDAPYLLEGIMEMGCLMNNAVKAIKAMTMFWRVKWMFRTSTYKEENISIAEHTAPLRACWAFAATDKIPFVSVFDKK